MSTIDVTNKIPSAKVKFSFAVRLILFSFILIIFSTSMIAYLTYQDSAKRLENNLGLELFRIANTATLMMGAT